MTDKTMPDAIYVHDTLDYIVEHLDEVLCSDAQKEMHRYVRDDLVYPPVRTSEAVKEAAEDIRFKSLSDKADDLKPCPFAAHKMLDWIQL